MELLDKTNILSVFTVSGSCLPTLNPFDLFINFEETTMK